MVELTEWTDEGFSINKTCPGDRDYALLKFYRWRDQGHHRSLVITLMCRRAGSSTMSFTSNHCMLLETGRFLQTKVLCTQNLGSRNQSPNKSYRLSHWVPEMFICGWRLSHGYLKEQIRADVGESTGVGTVWTVWRYIQAGLLVLPLMSPCDDTTCIFNSL